MPDQVHIGVIGTGFGTQHIRAFTAHPRAVVTAVCGTDAARAAGVAHQFAVPHAYDDYRTMLAAAPIDAVAIITPPATHAPLSQAALAAGKHVLCQKPLATSLAEARSLRDLARASGLVHGMDQNQRALWHSQLLKALLEAGAIGRPLSLTSAFGIDIAGYYANPTASPTKTAWYARRERGGGMLFANGGHVFDRLLWLFGPVQAVMGHVHTAVTSVRLPDGTTIAPDSDDSYHAVLEFESGLLGLAYCTPIAFAAVHARLEVHGTDGSLLETGLGAAATMQRATAAAGAYVPVAAPEHVIIPPVPAGVPEGIYALGDQFVRAILDGAPMSPTFEDGFRAQEVIEAVRRADQTGQRQVLPLA